MGLKERRAISEFEQSLFPRLKKDIDAAAGFEVPLDVKWEALAVDDYAHMYDECIPKIYFEPLVQALKAITVDAMGKQALKAGLKSVVVTNSGQYHSSSGFTFEGGVLTIDHRNCTNVDYVDERAAGIQQLLEKAL
jgi:hypothetical protein